jgi:hypothetical protein
MARIAWLSGGLVLIWLTAIAVGSGFEISFVAALILTGAFWFAAIGLQMAIGVRLSRTAEGDRRFQISTVLLFISYVAVYLVPIRVIISKIQNENSNVPWQSWWLLAVFLVIGSIVISAFQLVFAEAMVSMGLKLQHRFRSNRR